MTKIKTVSATILAALLTFAALGFGILALGFAMVLGGALAIGLRLAGPALMEKLAKDLSRQASVIDIRVSRPNVVDAINPVSERGHV